MKKFLGYFIPFLIVCVTLNYTVFNTSDSKRLRFEGHILKKINREVKKKYGLRTSGIGGGATEKYTYNFMVDYQYYGPPPSESEARRLIVGITQDILLWINEDPLSPQFLLDYPFSLYNLNLSIDFSSPEGKDYLKPDLTYVIMGKNEIDYVILDYKDGKRISRERSTENYEEARKIVELEHTSEHAPSISKESELKSDE